MTELKIQHIQTLSYLLSRGARYNHIPVTTSSLGKSIHKSQQAASRHLLELEQNKFITRMSSGRNLSVKITARGYSEMVRLFAVLQKSLYSSPSEVILEGTIMSGMGEGAYYMGLAGYTKQFLSKIGYVPFPGTLNIRLDNEAHWEATRQLGSISGTKIKGFSDGKRTYGWVKCFAAKLKSIDCQLIILERTHHDDSIIELISESCIKESTRLRDGSKVKITVQLDSVD